MGQVLKIEGEEAVALACELATLTGGSVEDAVVEALRKHVKTERDRVDYIARARASIDAFHATLKGDLPSSDHSFLYDDETGLPI